MIEVLALTFFGIGYIAISLEHKLFVNKAAASLILAVILWVIASIAMPATIVQEHIIEAGADIFGIVLFLLTSMTLVEILIHYHLFDMIERWLRDKGWTYYTLGWSMAAIAFLFSAVIDNLTTTIVAIQISRRLFPKNYLLPVGALIVIAANAGGAFSPIGDITTLMLWFAHKFSALQIAVNGLLPSVILTMVAGMLLLYNVPKKACEKNEHQNGFTPSRSDKTIIIATLASFFLPLAATPLGIPPYMGRLLALGGIWLLIDFAKKARPQPTHLQASINRFFQQVDIESLQFFVGILLAVSALGTLGILDTATQAILGNDPSANRIVVAFTSLGIGSAIVDNVPLTAAAIGSLSGISASLWTLLAITVGTGGSLLIIGSASGIIAMGMLPDIMTFGKYLRTATFPAFIGFCAAIAVWMTQATLFA